MITPGYAITSTERILPSVAIDFTTAILDARISITRALNTATTVNSSGYIETVNANTARFDYNPVTLACRGLLVEETRTNICTYSNTLSSWSKSGLGAATQDLSGPDGTTSGWSLSDTNAAGYTVYSPANISVSASTAYTLSMYIKKQSVLSVAPMIELKWTGGVTTYVQQVINPVTGGNVAFSGSTAPTSVSVTDAGNGWWRFEMVATSVASTNVAVITIYPAINTTGGSGGQTSATGSNGFYGVQLEAGAFATSYIATTTASVTRNADVAVMTGTNFSSWWKATTGSAVVNARQKTVSGVRPWIQFDDNSANNFIVMRGNATDPELYVKATTDQAQIDAGTIAANTSYALGSAWNTNNCVASLSGAAPVTDLSATIPTVTQARIGCDGTNYLNGWLQTFRYWPQTITNAETQAFSK